MNMPPMEPDYRTLHRGPSPTWIRLKRALLGWKMYVGAVVFMTPDILAFIGENIESAKTIKTIGSILVFIGLLHKIVRYQQPIDRRIDDHQAKVIERVDDVERFTKDA